MNKRENESKLVKKLKVHRVSLFFILLGAIFLYLPNVESIKGLTSLSNWLKLFGETFIVGGIITATYEYIVREETYREMTQEIHNEIEKAMVQESNKLEKKMPLYVAHALMVDKEVQKKILASTKINEIISTCLSTKLGEDMTKDLFEGVIHPVISGFEHGAQRVMYNYNLHARLQKREDNNKNKFYEFYLSIEYRHILKIPQLKFVCLTSRKEFDTCLKDPLFTYVYYLPVSNFCGEMFDVPSATIQCEGEILALDKIVEEENTSLKKIKMDHSELPQYMGKICKLFYRIHTIIRRDGHMFFVRIKHPVKDFRAVFDAGNTDIKGLYVSDQFVCSGGSMLENGSTDSKILKTVSVDGWVFPNSGVTFVWHY